MLLCPHKKKAFQKHVPHLFEQDLARICPPCANNYLVWNVLHLCPRQVSLLAQKRGIKSKSHVNLFHKKGYIRAAPFPSVYTFLSVIDSSQPLSHSYYSLQSASTQLTLDSKVCCLTFFSTLFPYFTTFYHDHLTPYFTYLLQAFQVCYCYSLKCFPKGTAGRLLPAPLSSFFILPSSFVFLWDFSLFF